MKDQEPADEPEQDQEPVPEPAQEPKRGRGRPVERQWPEPIPDPPENVARALMAGPPKADEDWRYLKKHRNRKRNQGPA